MEVCKWEEGAGVFGWAGVGVVFFELARGEGVLRQNILGEGRGVWRQSFSRGEVVRRKGREERWNLQGREEWDILLLAFLLAWVQFEFWREEFES